MFADGTTPQERLAEVAAILAAGILRLRTRPQGAPESADVPWVRYVHDPDEGGIGTVRWPRTVPLDELCARKLKKRTLTNLYNERPAWLVNAHRKLDQAVFAAYAQATGEAAWSPQMSDEQVLQALLSLNLQRP